MADTKISDLNALTYLTGTYLVPAVDIPDDANGTKKVTLSNFWLATDGIIPAARVYHDSAQAIDNTTITTLAFNTESFDTDVIHDTATNNSRLTCKTAGKYLIFATITFVANATGYRRVLHYLNGATYIADADIANATVDATTTVVCVTVYDLAVNDYVECRVRQNSGGSLNVTTDAPNAPVFGMVRIAD